MKSVSKLWGALALTVLIGAGFWWLATQEPASDRQAPSQADRSSVGGPLANSAASSPARTSAPAGPGGQIIPAPRPSVSAEFDLWAEKFIAAPTPQLRDALLEEGKSLALARRDQMVELIEQNPEQALNAALPYGIRKQLPDAIKALVEETVSGRGRFTPVHSKPLPGREAEVEDTTYRVVLNGWSYDAYTFGRRTTQPAREGQALHGIALTDAKHRRVLALSDSPFRVLESDEVKDRTVAADAGAACTVCARRVAHSTHVDFGGKVLSFCHPGHAEQLSQLICAGEAVPEGGNSLDFTAASFAPASSGTSLPPGGSSRTQGIKKLLLIPAVFADDPRPVTDEDQLQRVARDNNQYYVDGSYGTASILTTVTPQITLPGTRSFYNEYLGQLHPDAVAAVQAMGYTDPEWFVPSKPAYVIFPSVPGILFGGRSDGLIHGGISLGVLAHELGHNFGLPHGVYLNSSGSFPGPIQPRNPPPGPYPIDSDGITGHDDINAPIILRLGERTSPLQDYGNIYDVMGSGNGHFCVTYKNGMNWLPDPFVPQLSGSSTNRVYAFDTPSITDSRTYGLRIRKNSLLSEAAGRLLPKVFVVSHREGYPNNPWMVNGVEVLWGNILLDTTPKTAAGKEDAAVVVGRTFSDPESHVHITPIAKGGGPAAGDKWIDVVTQIGPFPGNRPPVFTLTATELNLPLGGTVTFTATATDPDGDALAYNWDFDAGRFGLNQPVMTRTFSDDGHYVVRCEVSDMKGGVARANLLVTVGAPSAFVMSGRVVDDLGNPLSGVRVHNNAAFPPFFNPGAPEDPNVPVQPLANGPAYRFGYTDDNGFYTIGNVPAGTYTNRAFVYGYRTEPLFVNPVVMQSGDAGGLDHIAFRLQKVSVEKEFDCADESTSGSFLFRREGDASEPLQVLFVANGNAVRDVDYEGFHFITTNVVFETNGSVITTNFVARTNVNFGSVGFPAGVDSVSLPVVPIGNSIGDGGKDVILTLMLQTNSFRISSTLTNVVTTNGSVQVTNTVFIYRTNQVRIPGWELLPDGPGAALTWFQTYPTYVIGTAEARVRILDDDAAGIPAVSLSAVDADAIETRGDSAMLVFLRSGAPTNAPLQVRYVVGGTASNGLDYVSLPGTVTIPAGSQALFLPVAALRDELVEGRESITVTIEDPGDGSYTGSGASATVYIIDDDLPLVSIYSTDSIANKSGNAGSVTISRTGDLTESLLVNYLSSGSATGGVDYVILPGSIVIPAGQVTATVNITPLNNPNVVGPRTATILLSDSPAYNVSPLNVASVVINDNLPVVTLEVTSSSPSESGVAGVFTVTRTGPVTNQLTVNFAVGGLAYEGFDYSPIGTNVTIPVGSSTATISIVANPDAINEIGDINGNDDVIVQLLAGPGYLVGNPSSGLVTLSDDDGGTILPAVGFLLRNSTWREGELATIAARISSNPNTNNPNRGTAVVDYRVTSGSAIPNVNYTPNNGSLTFTHYSPPDPRVDDITNPLLEGTIRTIQIQTLLDNLPAGTKTLTLTLSNPSGYTTNVVELTNSMGEVIGTNITITKIITNAFLGPYTTHTVNILDIETNALSVVATVPLAYEEGLVPGQFTITRTGSLAKALKVDFSVTGTAASGNDFVALSPNKSVTIPAGTNAVVIPVFPLDDPQQEQAESVILTLLPRPGVTVGASATVVIVDNDGTIQFTIPQFSVSEGVGTGLIPLQRTGATNRTVSVDYVLAAGTATLNVDYQTTNGTITFLPGEVTKMILVPILEDSLVEGSETFGITLTGTSGGVPLGGQNEITVVIEDNDTAFDFTGLTFSAAENSTNAYITVRRYGVTTNAVSVTLATTNGTASSGDYVGTNTVLNFGAGQTNYTFSLRILDDLVTESNETVLLGLSGPSLNTQLGNTNTATLTIVEDECRVEFTAASYSFREYLGRAIVNVQRVGGRVNDVTVNYATAYGSATSLDLTATNGTLIFRGDHYEPVPDGSGDQVFVPGDTNLSIIVTLFDDTIGEINETFTVGLIGLTGPVAGSATYGSVTNTTVTIIDNEGPGNLDFEFNPGTGANGPVRTVALQAEGRIVFGGDFTAVDGIELRRIARLQADGYLDPSFSPGAGADGPVYAVAVQSDNRIVMAGNFTNVAALPRMRVARLNADGNIDASFAVANAADQTVRALALQTNGQILIGGDFQNVAGTSRRGIARLNSNGSVDGLFSPIVSGSVRALAVQSDGKILVGGIFTNVAGSTKPFLARLTSAGAVDPAFSPGTGPNGPVYSLALQGDGKILIGGAFTNFNGVAQPYVARLNADGSLDGTFDTGTDVNGPVNSVGVHSNGRITIGGAFTSVDGISRNRFARLRSTGALDTAFDPGTGANSNVLALVVQPNTAVVIGGEFTQVDGVSRNHIARIHGEERSNLIRVEFAEAVFRAPENAGTATVTVVRSGNTNAAFAISYATVPGTASDPADYAGVSGSLSFASNEVAKTFTISLVNDLLLEGDETVSLGLFNFPAGSDNTGTTNATLVIQDNERIVQLASNAYTAFEAQTNAQVYVVRLGGQSGVVTVNYTTSGGTAVAGQDYTNVSATLTLEDGETNKAFQVPLIDNFVQNSSKTFNVALSSPVNATLGSPASGTVTILDDEVPGNLDRGFGNGPGANGSVRSLALQSDGKIVVGGAFSTFGGITNQSITRLKTNGEPDLTFHPSQGANGAVMAVAAMSGNRVVLAGSFDRVNGALLLRIARLLDDGSLDPTFTPPAGPQSLNSAVTSIAPLQSGKLLIGGGFSVPSQSIAQLVLNGSIDASFSAGEGANGVVQAISPQPDGSVVVGGAFTTMAGFSRSRVARLDRFGQMDTAFGSTPAVASGTIYDSARQSDGKLIVVGDFSLVDGLGNTRITRLKTDGSLDTTFDVGSGANAIVYAVGVQANDKIIVVGDFSTIDGTPRGRIARLNADGSIDTSFDPGSGANATVYTLLLLPDDNLLIGGAFTSVSGQPRGGLARIFAGDSSVLQVTGISIGPGGAVNVTFTGIVGRTYVLEASTDLMTWLPVDTTTASTTTVTLTDPSPANTAQQFYRVREQ